MFGCPVIFVSLLILQGTQGYLATSGAYYSTGLIRFPPSRFPSPELSLRAQRTCSSTFYYLSSAVAGAYLLR